MEALKGFAGCRLEKGTTYNSYIIYGDKTALVDASHEKFRGLYMKTLKQELESKGRTLDYIVVSHTEPDHSGAPLTPVHPDMKGSGLLRLHKIAQFLFFICLPIYECHCVCKVHFHELHVWHVCYARGYTLPSAQLLLKHHCM